MVDQLLTGMDRAHQAVVPSHIFMVLDRGIDETTANRLTKIKGIEDIEVANEVGVRYKVHPEDEWRAARLIMRKDYEDQTYDILQLKEGEWPKKDKFGIERLSSQTFGINIGDKVIFELDKSDRALPITGKIRHNFVEPPDFGGDAVFFTDAQGLERFNIPEGEYKNLFIRVTPYSADFAHEMASEIKDRLAKEDVGVNFTNYQDPEEHWGRRFIEGINLVLQILAIISLGMSVILVTNTMTALITQQTNQIGMIKAVGGTTGAILKVYMAAVLIYGSLAFIISLPFGALVAYGISKWFLNLFNIDYEVFQISIRAVLYQIIAATLIPLLAALWPVLSGAAITVREAIASYGLGGDFGSSPLDKRVERLGQRFLSSPYAIALGNLFRRKGRLILTQLVLVGAGTMFLIVMSLSTSITYTLNTDMNRRGFDVRIGFRDPQRTDRVETMAHKVRGVDEAETWFTTPAAILKEGQSTQEAGVGAELIGIPEGSAMYHPLIVAGRWLEPGDTHVIVINRDTAEDNNINVGDIVTLNLFELGDDEWQVVGLFQIIFSGGFDTEPIYAPEAAVFNATKKYNDGDRLFVSTVSHSPQDVEAIYQQLKDNYEDRNMDIDVFSTGTTPDDIVNAVSQFSITTTMLMGLAVIVAMVGGIGLMGSLSISVVERTREIGVMRAIGARSMTIMGMFVMEGVLQGVFSWIISVPLSFVLARPLANALGQAMFDANLD
ncbi:MAG: FtsX-like permease family protein, partial [Anaerolineae bacterium]|nr:FtsX-like permease family protein [Anaerolineae bacterium]